MYVSGWTSRIRLIYTVNVQVRFLFLNATQKPDFLGFLNAFPQIEVGSVVILGDFGGDCEVIVW